MALNLVTNPTFASRITGASAAYPYGSSRNESTPDAGDGTPYNLQRADDVFGFQQALLSMAGITPSGSADSVTESQYLQALVQLASGRAGWYDDVGAADAYVLDVKTSQPSPAAYFDGSLVFFIPANTSTAASTVDVAGLGAVDIKLKGGVADVGADDLRAGREEKLTYRTSPSAHFELSRAGRVKTTVISVSDPAWTPSADTTQISLLAVGGGGGGGGCALASGDYNTGSGGGGGGAAITYPGVVDASYAIVIGAGGAGGAGGNDTTVTSASWTLNGGGGGAGTASTAGNGLKGFRGGAAGAATGGDVNLNTGYAPNSAGSDTAGAAELSRSLSGVSVFGGAVTAGGNGNGTDATVTGAGGGGATDGFSVGPFVGGAGANGAVVITEFFS